MSYALGNISIYTLNTKNRIDNGDNPSVSRHEIKLPNGNLYDRVVMLSCSIPYSYYQVLDFIGEQSNQGNLFQIRVNAINYDYEIPVGNYTRFGIANKMQELIRADFPTATVTYPYDVGGTQDGKLTFSIPNAGLDTITIALADDSAFYIKELLGFSNRYTGYWRTSRDYDLNEVVLHNGTRYNCILANYGNEPPNGTYWQSSYISTIFNTTNADPAIIRSVNPIHTKIPSTLFVYSDVVKSSIDDYILQEIEVRDEGHFSSIAFQQYDVLGNSRELSYREHRYFDFTLLDSRKKLIDLNGLDYTFTIMFFRHDPISLFQLEQIRIENIAQLEKMKKRIELKIDEKEEEEKEEDKPEPEPEMIQETKKPTQNENIVEEL